ncbi:hypothetical protein [Nitratireductor sp. OM-1]|uniref:hypothetical protein n=1 Tax=Nitratireductor sp. OM-1 TaxID=1756988 RepID=UPI000DDD1318|nr:hypothetical protein [Nitratireductor sp. OM-1]
MFAHTIPEDGVFIAEGMTHELTLHILAPTVPIDFERDLFQQPALAPVVPAIYGFQWDANACDWLDTGSGGVTELLRTAGASFELETLDEYTDKVVAGKAPLYREEELLAAE